MTCERFYESRLQQPILLWCAAALGLVAVLAQGRIHPSVRRFCIAWSVVPFLDAWLTGDEVLGVGALPGDAATSVATFFVIVGDLRVFLFLEGANPRGDISLGWRGSARAAAWSLVVPVASAVARAAMPDASWKPRAVYFAYEAAFLVVMIVWLLRRATAHGWARAVVSYVLVYYGLWAIADAILLGSGADVGYLVRVVPNILYYGGLLTVVSAAAPRGGAGGEPNLPKG